MKTKKGIAPILFLFSLFSFGQTSISNSTVDAYVEYSNSSDNFSAENSLKLKHSASGSNERVAFLKFSKNEIPSSNFEQVLLKLVKTSGNEGNVSVVGTSSSFNNSITWNSMPSSIAPFIYGGVREDDTYYLDVTDYVLDAKNSSNSEFAFKLFTNSIINSPITFASNEASVTNNRPQLLYYSTKQMNIPLYDIHSTTIIDMDQRGHEIGEVLKDHSEQNNVNEYGGWENGTFEATGFFRTEKDCENTWHIVDPNGNAFYSAGLNSVDDDGDLSLPNDLKNLGLNTMGSWSDETINNMAYTPRFNVMVNFKNTNDDIADIYDLDILPVFESDFENFCKELAQEELIPYLNDPWVLGYFLDNELPFHKDQLSLSLNLSSNNAQFQAAHEWMINRYGSGYLVNDITEADETDYQGYVAETYFRIVTNAFREVDSNHMLIGTRLHGGAKYIPQLFEASGDYLDVISINYYSRYEPEEDVMEMWLDNSGKPFIITEFYVKGQDTGLSNEDGAGWEVATQEDRAKWYENWMLKLLRNKANVGFHWFRFIDNPDNDSNKGLYDKDYNIYEELGASIEQVSKSIYTLRSQILYGNYNYNDCDFVDVETTIPTTPIISENFTPDPNKTYYIDAPYHDLRLASSGESEDAYTTSTSTTGADVEWRFVDKGNGYWHIQRADGGSKPRLRTDNSEYADMQPTDWSGTYTYYDFSEGYMDNTFFLTLPDGPSNYQRLQVNNQGVVSFVSTSHNQTWESFTITEAGSLANFSLIEAEDYDGMSGIQTENSSENGENVGWINNGDWLRFDAIDLTSAQSIDLRVASKYDGGTIEVRIGSATGTLLGSASVLNTGGNQNWETISANLSNASGTQDVYLVFAGGSGYLFNVNWLEFSSSLASAKSITDVATNNIVIYPNPVESEATINGAANSVMNIYDINGVLLVTQNISNESEQVNLEVLSTGIYYAQIFNSDNLNNKALVFKLIKK